MYNEMTLNSFQTWLPGFSEMCRYTRFGMASDNEQLAQLAVDLRADDRLYIVQDETEQQEPQIICSLGLFEGEAGEYSISW